MLKAFGLDWSTVTCTKFYWPDHITRPIRIEEVEELTPSLNGRSRKTTMQKVWTQCEKLGQQISLLKSPSINHQNMNKAFPIIAYKAKVLGEVADIFLT